MKNRSSLFTLYIITFTQCLSSSFIYPVIPLYAAELGAPVSQVGFIVAIQNYVAALLLIPLGILSDKLGRHIFLIAGFLMCTITPLLYPLSTSPQHVILLRVLHGLAQAIYIPVTFALAADMAPADRRGESMGWFTMSLALGFMAGPVAGGFLLDRLGFEAAFYGCGAIALIGLLFVLFRLGTMSQIPARELSMSSPWAWLKQRAAIAGILVYMFVPFGINTIIAYIPLYGKSYGITESGAGLIITVIFASTALFRGLTGRLSDKLGRKLMIIVGLAVSTIAVAFISQLHDLHQLVALAFCFGVGNAVSTTATLALVADLSPMKARGLSMGIMTCSYQFGLALGPTAMGFIAETSNFITMFLACGACLAFILLIVVGLMRTR